MTLRLKAEMRRELLEGEPPRSAIVGQINHDRRSFCKRNPESSDLVSLSGNDESGRCDHIPLVADELSPNWFLQDWMRLKDKRQVALVNELGWSKGKASKFWNGKYDYRREIVNEVAAWLEIEPYELLMAPDVALSLRSLRQSALAIAAEQQRAWTGPDPDPGAARLRAR